MLKTIPVRCAGCGASLDITPEMDQFSCGYCGVAQTVQRQGGTIALKLVGDAIRKVQVGTDKTAAELAIKRLSGEAAALENGITNNQMLKKAALTQNNKTAAVLWGIGLLISFFIASSVVGGVPLYNANIENSMNMEALSETGDEQPHNNLPPFLGVQYIIALQGVYPQKWQA